MSYMFKKKSKLDEKQRKKKISGWASAIGLLLVLIEVVLTGLLLYEILELDMLPASYLIPIIAVLSIILLYNLISQFTRAHIIGKILAVIMSALILFVYLFAAKFSDTISKVLETEVNTDIVDICVLATDRAITIDDCADYTFGYNSTVSNSNVTASFEDIKKDIGKSVETKEYGTWTLLIEALTAQTDIQAIAINDSMINIITQEDSEFLDKIRIVKSYKYTSKVETTKSSVNVKNESFVIYISGISSDDGSDSKLASYALSDVNILAVVNPTTRQIMLVTTPRDSYIQISNNNGYTGYDKLTHAGIYGIERSIEALENLYGIDIDYYVKINFSGAIDVVDALGGITINSEVEFTNGDEAAPIAYHFVVGDNECDGAKTIAFTRERMAFLSGDIQRGKNQAAAVKAIIQKATSTAILTRYSAVLDAVSDSFLTNIPNSAISDLVKAQLSDSTPWNIQSYGITASSTGLRYLEVTGLYNASVVYPNYDEINIAIKLMNRVINGDIFDADEYVTELEEANKATQAATQAATSATTKAANTAN